MPIVKEIVDILDLGLKPSQVFSVVLLHRNLQKLLRIVFPLCDSFRLLLLPPINGPIE